MVITTLLHLDPEVLLKQQITISSPQALTPALPLLLIYNSLFGDMYRNMLSEQFLIYTTYIGHF